MLLILIINDSITVLWFKSSWKLEDTELQSTPEEEKNDRRVPDTVDIEDIHKICFLWKGYIKHFKTGLPNPWKNAEEGKKIGEWEEKYNVAEASKCSKSKYLNNDLNASSWHSLHVFYPRK